MAASPQSKEPDVEHNQPVEEGDMDANEEAQGLGDFEVKEQDRWLPIANGWSIPFLFLPSPSGVTLCGVLSPSTATAIVLYDSRGEEKGRCRRSLCGRWEGSVESWVWDCRQVGLADLAASEVGVKECQWSAGFSTTTLAKPDNADRGTNTVPVQQFKSF